MAGTYSCKLAVCFRSDVFAERLSRYSTITSALPRTTVDWLKTRRQRMSPVCTDHQGHITAVSKPHVPYFAQRSRKPSHCLAFGISSAFPKNGSGGGPGGVESPRERALHTARERRYKKHSRARDKPSAYNRLTPSSVGRRISVAFHFMVG